MVSAKHEGKTPEFREEVCQRVGLAGAILPVGVGWALLPSSAYPYALLPVLAGLAAANGAALALLWRSRVRAASALIAAGDSLALLASLWIVPDAWLPYLALPIMLINALLISNLAGLGLGLAVIAAAWGLAVGGLRGYDLAGIFLVLGCGLGINWLSTSSLATAASWYRMAQARAEELLAETRQHRGELSRALKSLQLANDLQRKTQNELVLARKQAEQAKKMKEQFAANIGHELRTPLNLILGFSKLMYLSPEGYGRVQWTPELQHDIAQVYRSSRHLTEMVDDILDLSQFEMTGFSLVREPTPLEYFLKDAAETLGNLFRSGPVRFRTEIDEDLPVLEIDRTRIRQVLVNLLTNAYRYTSEGEVTLRAQNRGDEVHIAVIDTGPGIAPEKLPFIFDEFYQSDASLSRKAGGVGLGLTISRRFVEAHHGRIWVESQPGEGSVFTFTLPCGTSAVGDAREAPAAMYPELLPNMILVEPDPEVFQITRRQIEAYEWIQVESLKGLELAVRQYKPRAVVVNLSPEEVRQAPEAAGIDAPLIFCSLPRRLSREGELAQLTLLRKPIEMEDLVRELERNGGVRDLLVIDDDRGFIQLLERLITASGRPVELRRAYSGAEGLAAMAEQRPDLVLLDLVMPEVNGMQVLERMRAEASLAGIPVCLVTSGSYELETVTQGGQNILIHQAKGFRSEKVFGYLRALLHQIEPAGGLVEVEENS